jgi:hypothetical protein
MAPRSIKLREAAEPAPPNDERPSQRVRHETGRYLLQVDRQTKSSFTTAESAEAAGMVIKTGYPHVQVSIYDRVESQNRLLELPAAAK